MKKIIRIFALLLALLMVASCFVACKKDDDKPDDGKQDGNNAISTSGEYQSKLPDMDWGGESYLVLGQSDSSNKAWKTFEISRDEMPDDVVGKAVWERNDAIKQTYNIVIEEELVPMSYTHVQQFYASNEDKYDMVMYQLEGLFGHLQSGFLLDFTKVNYIDFDHPSWNDYTNEQFTFGSSVYAVSSDFNLQNKAQLYGMFYNREMARDAGDGYLEDLVTSNQWTLDKYNEIVKAYAADGNGNGTKGDEGDIFGTVGDQWSFLAYSTSAGYRASTVKDGVVEMAGAGDNVLNILEKVGKVLFDSQSSFITESIRPLDYGRSGAIFRDGRALIMFSSVTGIDSLNEEANFEFGILPAPKYDENQKEYYSQVNPKYSSVCCLPKTLIDVDFAGFGLEVLAETSTDTTYTAYIETKCKLQDSFDQRMSDMFTLIFKNPVYDLAIVADFGNLKRAMMEEVPAGKNASRYATFYSKRADAAQEEIDELLENIATFS